MGRATVRRPWRFVKAFYWKAYEDNLTGLAGMVAYNLLLSVFPLALLSLFIAGRVLESPELEQSVLEDLRQLFPSAADRTLTRALEGIRDSSTGFGIVALATSVYFGASFWGALDTAFCRIYHGDCRTWLQQKRFAIAMLGVVLLFMAATVAVPALQGLLLSSAEDLPFGLSDVRGVVFAATLAVGVTILFLILCLIYWVVPKPALRWRSIWPGALMATAAIAIVDYAFPLYLSRVSTISSFGTTLVFVGIALIWFYVLAIVILGGGVVNVLRNEATGGSAPPERAQGEEAHVEPGPPPVRADGDGARTGAGEAGKPGASEDPAGARAPRGSPQ